MRLRHAETLQPDGRLYVANLRGARCTDQYTLKGDGVEVYEPRFTYHGFRYVEVTGYPGEPGMDAIDACVVHDDLEPAGDFVCSHELLNRIHANCRWGIRGNYRSIPTDCPQRDERQGWLGDRATGCRGEMQLFHVAAFYEKWLTDMADAQRPDGSVSDVCPGLLAVLQRQRHLGRNHRPDSGPGCGNSMAMSGFIVAAVPGDAGVGRAHVPVHRRRPHAARQLRRLVRAAGGSQTDSFQRSGATDQRRIDRHGLLLPHPAVDVPVCRVWPASRTDAARYAAMAERMKTAFNKRFFDVQAARYDNGTQTSSLLPLSFGLAPPRATRRGCSSNWWQRSKASPSRTSERDWWACST